MTSLFQRMLHPSKTTLVRGVIAGFMAHYLALAALIGLLILARPFVWPVLFGEPYAPSPGQIAPGSGEGTVLQIVSLVSWVPAGVAAVHWAGARWRISVLALLMFLIVISVVGIISGSQPSMTPLRAMWFHLCSPAGLLLGALLHNRVRERKLTLGGASDA